MFEGFGEKQGHYVVLGAPEGRPKIPLGFAGRQLSPALRNSFLELENGKTHSLQDKELLNADLF